MTNKKNCQFCIGIGLTMLVFALTAVTYLSEANQNMMNAQVAILGLTFIFEYSLIKSLIMQIKKTNKSKKITKTTTFTKGEI